MAIFVREFGNYQLRAIKKVKWSRYRPGVAQRVGRDIALLFHDRGTRKGWVVSSMPRPHFTPGKDPVPILQETWWAPGPVWMGGKSRPHQDSIPDRPARSQSLYRLSYPAHTFHITHKKLWYEMWERELIICNWHQTLSHRNDPSYVKLFSVLNDIIVTFFGTENEFTLHCWLLIDTLVGGGIGVFRTRQTLKQPLKSQGNDEHLQ